MNRSMPGRPVGPRSEPIDPPSWSTIRILIVDDEPLVRQGLKHILAAEPDQEIVGEAADGSEVLELVRRARPHVVCMDVRMPGIDGIRATELLLRLPDPPKVLVVSTFEHDEYVLDALVAGASGFLLKRAPAEEMVQAVRTITRGTSLLFPAAVRELVRPRARTVDYTGPALSGREAEVLDRIAPGPDQRRDRRRSVSRRRDRSHLCGHAAGQARCPRSHSGHGDRLPHRAGRSGSSLTRMGGRSARGVVASGERRAGRGAGGAAGAWRCMGRHPHNVFGCPKFGFLPIDLLSTGISPSGG